MALKLLQMDYPFSGPWGSEMAEEYSYLARRIADVSGLICKVWTENPGTGEAGGIYLFEDEASLDSYLEGNETFTVSLSNPSGAALGAQSTTSVVINDNDIANGANPIGATNFFVRQQYLDFLNREPDAPGRRRSAGARAARPDPDDGDDVRAQRRR